MQRMELKDCKGQGLWITTKKQHFPYIQDWYTDELTETRAACSKPGLKGRGEVGTKSCPWLRRCLRLVAAGKGKDQFSSMVWHWHISHTPRQPPPMLNMSWSTQTLFFLPPFCFACKSESLRSCVGREVEEKLREVGGRERMGSKRIA